MIFDVLPFLVYLALFSLLITRIPFFKKSGIAAWVLISLFCIKVGVGIVYGFYFNLPSMRETADTWRFYRESIPETQLLLHHPYLFARSLFVYGYAETGGLFVGKNSYWNDLKDNIIIKIFAVCNVFSRTNYYTNTIFFNFFYLFGIIAFYKLIKIYSHTNQYLLLATIFLMPSFLFWGSGIHKDGFLFSALGLSFYCFHEMIKRGPKVSHIILLSSCFLFIFFIRNYLALALIPAFFSWWVADRNHQRHQFYFIAVYSGGLLLLMAIALLGDHFNALCYVVNKHNEFLLLSGNSAIQVPKLIPHTESVIQYFPIAIDIAFFRPHVTEIKNIAYLLSFGELLLCTAITICFLWLKKDGKLLPPFFIACFYLASSILILDGYTVTFTGAIVRYRSLMMPFVIVPMVGLIPFKTLFKRKKDVESNPIESKVNAF